MASGFTGVGWSPNRLDSRPGIYQPTDTFMSRTIIQQPEPLQHPVSDQATSHSSSFNLLPIDCSSTTRSSAPRSINLVGMLDLDDCTPHVAGLNQSSLVPMSDLDINELDDEDVEGVKKILCSIPMGLGRTADGNSLPFVLQWHAQWIPLTTFDPNRIIHQTKETLIKQFSESSAARFRLILISELKRCLIQHRALDEGGQRVFQLLRDEIYNSIGDYHMQQQRAREEQQGNASSAIDHIRDLMCIQLISAPLSSSIQLLESVAAIFLDKCLPNHPPCLASIVLGTEIHLKSFVVIDVAISVTTGRPLSCRYHVPWSLELCETLARTENAGGLQWMLGIPDQFILLVAYMDGLQKDAKDGGTLVDTRIIEQIEDDINRIVILPCHSSDPSLAIGRLVVQECWREAVSIYLYMSLCGTHALDARVVKAQRKLMRLVNRIKPGRNPDAFLRLPMIIAGVSATKPSHRHSIRSRILGLPECARPNTSGSDSLRMLEDVWAQTNAESRAALWKDMREACWRVTGF